MQTSTIRLYSLQYNNVRTYLAAVLFVAGNILLPAMFHTVPHGGPTWLPIYFFTLFGAYKYGWRVGLMTAVFSPLLNCWLTGMPRYELLPPILLKSVLLAFCAAYAAARFKKVPLAILIAVVLAYQVFGTLGEWFLSYDLHLALQDFRMGIPGMLLQIIGCRVLIPRF